MRRIRNALGGAALVLSLGMALYAQSSTSAVAARSQAAHKTVHAATVGGQFAFAPKKTSVKVGTKVTWADSTGIAHTVTSKSTHTWKFNKPLSANGKVSYTFKKAGTYKYYCAIHPFMVGTVVVKK